MIRYQEEDLKNPGRILQRIVILQILFQVVLTLAFGALVVPYLADGATTASRKQTKLSAMPSLDWLTIPFDWTLVRFETFQGYMAAASYGITSLAMSVCVWKSVRRSKKCADFSFTIYCIHGALCWAYGKAFPNSAAFWVCLVTSFALTAVIAERLCMREELEDIPLASLISSAPSGSSGMDLAGSKSGKPRPGSHQEMVPIIIRQD